MPKSRRPKPLYQRGGFRLDRRPDSPNLTITWYDPERKRERFASARTSDVEIAKRALDARFLAQTHATALCPTCGQPISGQGSAFVTSVIADYLIAIAENRDSSEAIRHRLNHVETYIGTLHHVPTCDDIDEAWVDAFRRWFIKIPIVSPKGNTRQRSLSTVENSVLQLSAAINWGRSKGMTLKHAQFRATPMKSVNRTPMYRASVQELAAMFRYASDPRMKERRRNLLRFLRISVATLARPDAAHDVSTDPALGQWNSKRRVLNLNPKNRRQTKKYRATVPVVEQVAAELDVVNGRFIPVESVKSAFGGMMAELKMPGDGETGLKLTRRSMADLLRERLPNEHWNEIEMFLGHDKFDDVSDLYAPRRPDYLRHVKAEIAVICDEILALAPNAFYRSDTAVKR